jgi:hypothetical protein
MDGEQIRQLEEQWHRTREARQFLELHSLALAARAAVPAPALARKWRLAAVACCRALWPLLVQGEMEEACRAVEVAEAVCDGEADDGDLYRAGEAIRRTRVEEEGMCWYDDAYAVGLVCGPLDYAQFAAYGVTESNPEEAALEAAFWANRCFRRDGEMDRHHPALVHRLRDILGNPFHPVALDPGWLRPPVPALARAIYQGQRFEDLPVLADALEEAGCADPGILDHCRKGKRHARGCWLLDLLTRRS